MAKTEPFLISAEDRAAAVTVLMRIIENGSHQDQIEACRVLVEADALNLQAGCQRAPREPWQGSVDDD